MNNCDRCGKRIKSGTLCPICNAYVEGYVQGAKAEEKVALNKFAEYMKNVAHIDVSEYLYDYEKEQANG